MTHSITCEISSHAEAIQSEATRILAKNLCLSKSELEASAELLALSVARLRGLAKSLPEVDSVGLGTLVGNPEGLR